MLIALNEILALLPEKPKRILHVGGHKGEDKRWYDENGLNDVFYIEPNPEIYPELEKTVGSENCWMVAVSDKSGETVDFHRVYDYSGENKGCSSILKPDEILKNPHLRYVDTIQVNTQTIDMINWLDGPFDFWSLDVQEFELIALKGAKKYLKNNPPLAILVEFTLKPYYQDGCILSELDEFLAQYNFKRVITKFATCEERWGDSLYVRSS
jgi:FkbM family methyltransferase